VVTCRVLGFSKQAFYAWCKQPVSQRDWDDAHLINAAVDIHHDDPAFGYRFIADELRERGIAAGENGEGKLYLCAITDVYSGRIVGYSIDSRMKASLAVAALRNAIIRRDPVDTVVHSDRGSQFRSNTFVRTIKNNGLVGSMGRVGACGGNAAMESFFALLQKNVLDRQRWATREELRLAIITWIERTYHRRRRQRRLGRLTPVEYETLNLAATAA
jgi:transposase InsO family protein